MEDLDIAHSGGAEEDLSLPKATMAKLIQEYLPADVHAQKETKDLLTDCSNLGFEEYVKDVQDLVVEHQKTERGEKRNAKQQSQLSEEELLKLQEEMFSKAKERMAQGSTTQ